MPSTRPAIVKRANLVVGAEFAVNPHGSPKRFTRVPYGYGARQYDRVRIEAIRDDIRFVGGKKKTTKLYDCKFLLTDVEPDAANSEGPLPGMRTFEIANFLMPWADYSAARREYLEDKRRQEEEAEKGPRQIAALFKEINKLLRQHGVQVGDKTLKNVRLDDVLIDDVMSRKEDWEVYLTVPKKHIDQMVKAQEAAGKKAKR